MFRLSGGFVLDYRRFLQARHNEQNTTQGTKKGIKYSILYERSNADIFSLDSNMVMSSIRGTYSTLGEEFHMADILHNIKTCSDHCDHLNI